MARLRFSVVGATMVAALALAVAVSLPTSSNVLAAPADQDGWKASPSYTINYLGRDGPEGSDHYRVTLDWGATLFDIAVETMPLLRPLEAMGILTDGYRAAYPDRRLENIQPGDSFEFYVPVGTLVCARWRQSGTTREYTSLRGDSLTIYNNYRNPVLYRLIRVEDPGEVEITINPEADLRPYDLAVELYGRGDPGFRPDLLQVTRARDAIRSRTPTVVVDTARSHIDDLWELMAGAESGGKTAEGFDVYWFGSREVAQPLFRVDDAIGAATESTGLPSLMRVYYYKDGTVRTYQRAGETTFLSGRQPRNDTWARVYAEYGRAASTPNRWELGQPEQGAAAEEMNSLGVIVLRYQPKEPPKGNFFTRLLDLLMSYMNRKQG